MFNKKTVATEILFILLVSVTSIFYFDIGQWKAYVRLFGILEILISLTTLLIFTVRIINKSHASYTPLLLSYGIICFMQLFPMIGTLIFGIYYNLAIIHLIIIIMGVFNITELKRWQRNLI